ncbi:hypothetical protein Pst134EA_026867 [Puccinia striiformis f. sp. tritici]|uniref:hypothetical protein n=1 Tax=Puccinia striiformis f. sp. tritici TaxID=168172 RepID=UPI002007F33C|nr:hypothetical protein Pst134EA_026867 [Puccinia striiformis f. sp. tritici]KAH9450158.1 hypothetical protein Pst134EA_026867 [Puccinia striiformis f. sp. tritici]
MASSFVHPKSRPHSYQPILPSRYPPPYFNPNKSAGLDQPALENPPHFSESPVTRLMPSSGRSPGAPTGTGFLQDRITKLEASLPAMHDAYQREISTLRNEVESLKGLLASKTPSLNKNATPFVPGPAPMTPPTPVDYKRPSPLVLAQCAFDHDVSASDYSPRYAKWTPAGKSSLAAAYFARSSTLRSEWHPPSPTTSLYTSSNVPLSHANKASAPQPPTGRASQRHPGNLTIAPSLPSPILPSNNSTDSQLGPSQSRPNTNLRLRLFSPINCQMPVSSPAPQSPLTHDPSMPPCGASPMNSLAGKWEQLGIAGDVLRAIVRFGVGPPSKTQQKSIPNMLLGKDLISQSNPIQERIQSYIIPALQLITNDMNGSTNTTNSHFSSKTGSDAPIKCNSSVKVLVIAATLDEAGQAHRLARGIAALLPHPPKIVHCGASESTVDLTEPAGAAKHSEPHLLIGTPSKLLDPVNGLRGYTFDATSFICVILDEMDQLLARNLSDMVTSLMTFLPSNSSGSETSQPNPPSLLSRHEGEMSGSPPRMSASEEWNSSPPRQSPRNSAASSISSSDGRMTAPGRQTCIFSCTLPQDVLAFARSLNLRVKVIVRREENNGSASCNTPSAMTPMAANFDLGDPRTPHLTTFPWTNQSGNGNSTSTHQLLRHLSQFYYRVENTAYTSPNPRDRKLRSLIELLFDKEVTSLRAGRGQLVIVYCNSVDSVEVVSCALAQSNIDVIALHQDMGPAARHSLLAKFGKAARESSDETRAKSMKVLVVYDVLSKTLADISKDQPSIVINFELPRAVEDYIHRAGCIISIMSGSQRRTSVSGNHQDAALINLVHAGSETDTIKSIESFCEFHQSFPRSLRITNDAWSLFFHQIDAKSQNFEARPIYLAS